MRTLRKIVLSLPAPILLLCFAARVPAQTVRDPMEMEPPFARHFPEKPPVVFEFTEGVKHRSQIITNLHQYALTAYAVQTGTATTTPSNTTNIYIHDALTHTGLLAPIPKGLSHVTTLPRGAGGTVPNAKLIAAVWEDGSTYGPDELIARISNSRKALADSYDHAIDTLQTGLAKNWTAQEYVDAAQQLKPPMPPHMATVEEAESVSERLIAQGMPSHTITVNMQRAAQEDLSAKSVAILARVLLKEFTRSRDVLRRALAGSTASADQATDR
jgi:hypothetical protein